MDLSVHHDKIIGVFNRIGAREKERASDAGEDREEIGGLIELTGLHKKAVSFVRMLHKQEDDKREDILRSLRPLLDLMDAHWNGQKTPDMFDTSDDEVASDEAKDPDFEKHLAEVEASD